MTQQRAHRQAWLAMYYYYPIQLIKSKRRAREVWRDLGDRDRRHIRQILKRILSAPDESENKNLTVESELDKMRTGIKLILEHGVMWYKNVDDVFDDIRALLPRESSADPPC